MWEVCSHTEVPCLHWCGADADHVRNPPNSKATQCTELEGTSYGETQVELVRSEDAEEDRENIRHSLRFSARAALWVCIVPVTLAERCGILEIILIPQPADTSSAALRSLRQHLQGARVQHGNMRRDAWRHEFVHDEVVRLCAPIPHGMRWHLHRAPLERHCDPNEDCKPQRARAAQQLQSRRGSIPEQPMHALGTQQQPQEP
mmetsp:Transcript_90704/g.228097  ORF Transcript_90704/g.228097 Transcript_90704/m.228097 type:complete len:203 (-) Transcript_90704:873-1481(-)